MKICGIYKITNIENEIYIGSSKNIYVRIRHYIQGHSHRQPKLHASINKYGWNSHKFEIIEECTENVLFERERYYQELYNSMDNGLNMSLQATSQKKGVICKESRCKMSEKLKGNKYALGMKHTDEVKMKLSNFHKGKVWRVDFKHTEEARKKMSQNSPRKGKPIYDSLREGIVKANKKRLSKLVVNMDTGIYYISIKEAAYCHNMKSGTLAAMLAGRNNNKTSLKLA